MYDKGKMQLKTCYLKRLEVSLPRKVIIYLSDNVQTLFCSKFIHYLPFITLTLCTTVKRFRTTWLWLSLIWNWIRDTERSAVKLNSLSNFNSERVLSRPLFYYVVINKTRCNFDVHLTAEWKTLRFYGKTAIVLRSPFLLCSKQDLKTSGCIYKWNNEYITLSLEERKQVAEVWLYCEEEFMLNLSPWPFSNVH